MFHRKKTDSTLHGEDLEKGYEKTHRNSASTKLGGEGDFDSGDEYGKLLAFVAQQANAKSKGSAAAEEEGWTTKRVWYAPWKTVRVKEVEKDPSKKQVPEDWLNTDFRSGLDEAEVSRRRDSFGFNELEDTHENLFLKFLTFFQGPILYVMELAVILAAGMRDWIDFGVIIAMLLLNAFVGWFQEKQAGDIVAQLKAGIAMKAVVVRSGHEVEIEAKLLVPGDIIVVEEGNTIPADGKIVADYEDKDGSQARAILDRRNNKNKGDDDEGEYKGPSVCSADQSAITGESLAVDKFIGDDVFYTTGMKRGKVFVLITNCAKQSFVGRTAALVTNTRQKGHFQIVMEQIGTTLLVLVIFWIFAAWVGGFFRNVGIAEPKDNNLLIYTLIFMIVGVPVGLPCVTTTTLAVGAAYLARKKAIVQKLTAIESLAGVDMLCSDKTGTLTANQLSIHEPFVSDGVDVDWMMTVAVLASSHNIKSLDPIDKVTITNLKNYPGAQELLKTGWVTKSFTPFDPVSKRITSVVERDGVTYTCSKGAPNSILKMCKCPAEDARIFRETTMDFAKRGFRSLGVAVKEGNGDWQVLGLLPMFDPPRSDTAATVAEAQVLGLHIKMLTGDAVAIAKETCKMLNLGTNVYDSQQLMSSTSTSMTGSGIRDFVEAADGFAEVFPEHKYQVVEMLQARGHLTAMTGDGVNDAPSLKKADCGIAVEGASDAARTAADVVFLDEGLSTIITAIKVARQIFHRMKAYIIYRIALCLHLEIYLVLAMLIRNETIRAELVVFLAIFADVATIAIAYDNAPYARQPVDWQLPKIWVISTVLGCLLAAGTWILRASMITGTGVVQDFGSFQEIIFLEVALTENWLIFLTRTSQGKNSGGVTLPSWQLVGAVFGVDVLATCFALFGWMSGNAPHGGWTSVVTVVRVWLFSFGVTVIISLVYFLLNQWSWLDDLGKVNRSKRNEKLENFIHELTKLTISHEKMEDGSDHYSFGGGNKEEDKKSK